MKKILAISTIILVLLVSCFLIYNHNVKQHYVDVQKKRIELYLNYNLKGFNFKHITITKTYSNPMGANIIKGYINSDKSLYFTASIFSDTEYQFDGDIFLTEKLDSYFLKEDKSTNTNDIIKQKHLDKKDYEAKPPMFFAL
ncbi:DUF1433 domain-containing protein [Staphylococcus pasteuri]|uniref:DUF1433 domain-containing protein n=1 Tax=Staphylococcus pasteuri TaxID=45972 RepID=UPI003260C2E6